MMRVIDDACVKDVFSSPFLTASSGVIAGGVVAVDLFYLVFNTFLEIKTLCAQSSWRVVLGRG